MDNQYAFNETSRGKVSAALRDLDYLMAGNVPARGKIGAQVCRLMRL